jgi:hypothetical protein
LFVVLLLVPIGGAAVARGVTRILIMLIPLLLFAGLGLDWLVEKIHSRWRIATIVLDVALFCVLAWFNVYLLEDALKNGPLWDTDYGMSGVQYGAVQIAEKIPEFLARQHQPVHLIVSPTWANGTDMVMRFFFGTPLPFEIGNIDTFTNTYTPLSEDTVLLMTQEEITRLEESGKFTDVRILDRIPFPNGEPGFSFVKLQYVHNIRTIFRAEAEAREGLQVEELPVDGVPAEVSYSYLDMGSINEIFDHDEATLIRTMEANPLEIRIKYSRPLNIDGCTALIGGTASDLALSLYDRKGILLGQYQLAVDETPLPRSIDFEMVPQNGVQEIRFLLKNSQDDEPAHVHLWEITCSREAD